MAEPLVTLDSVSLGYSSRPILQGVTLSVQSPDFLALVGPNGAGKTTILRAIAGILRPLSGRLTRSPAVAIGYVPQERRLDPVFPLSAIDVVLQGRIARLGPWRGPGPADRDVADRALAQAGVIHLSKTPFQELSGGQKQRVLIARALAAEPTLMILDEPTAGMDAASERDVMDLLLRLHGEGALSIVLATHDLSLVGNYARRIVLMDRERQVFAVGAVEEILTDEMLTRLYGRAIRVRHVGGRRTILTGGVSC
jgi:ABC-type Mn2+/Zn2+ transport system ATPase subunit